ncbi:MAG: ABC transporter ATP-binding protein [Treponema sp.]|nr:ABC transporter ATP-binding protein [Treponema sp.]
MKISIGNVSFDYAGKKIFEDFSLDLDSADFLPSVILGPSGCGKTTLLKLLAGILKPAKGSIQKDDLDTGGDFQDGFRANVSMIFQEPRFLPWYTILENIMLPIIKIYGIKKSEETALKYLELVSLSGEASSLPGKLSGGQRQRASIARAFAYPSGLLLMDEPFQSMDIPLRIELMELCLALLEKEKRLTVAVTHDPREAVFMGSRIIILGHKPCAVVFDQRINLNRQDRSYGAAAAGELEKELIGYLGLGVLK